MIVLRLRTDENPGGTGGMNLIQIFCSKLYNLPKSLNHNRKIRKNLVFFKLSPVFIKWVFFHSILPITKK